MKILSLHTPVFLGIIFLAALVGTTPSGSDSTRHGSVKKVKPAPALRRLAPGIYEVSKEKAREKQKSTVIFTTQ
jgi:hypothetical protein